MRWFMGLSKMMLKLVRQVSVPALALGALVLGTAQAAAYKITTVAKPGAAYTQLWDVNNNGIMVGNTNSEAFIYDGREFTKIESPEGITITSALGISDTGVVVGAADSDFTPGAGFIFDGTDYTIVERPGADISFRGVSPDGRYVSGLLVDENNTRAGIVYDTETGEITQIGIGGRIDSTSGDTFELTVVQGINSSYQLVGSRFAVDQATGSPVYDSFIYDITTGERSFFEIDSPRVTATRARDITDDGEIVGFVGEGIGSGVFFGFAGYPDDVTFLDQPLLSLLVQGTNNSGILVGTENSAVAGFIATPVPLPAALQFFAFGLAGLGLTTRRRWAAS